MWVHKPEEQEFLFSYLDKSHKMLEYGSGQSTIEFASKVKHLVSVEHHKEWAGRVFPHLPSNVSYLYVPPNISGYVEGTLDEFYNYIHAPLGFFPFDVIFIDGRARVECSKIASKSVNNPLIFFHDFGPKMIEPGNESGYRNSYDKALEWLEVVDSAHTMYLFKKKGL